MPLLKKKPFSLLEPPEDLKLDEFVYQIRFTKEIFRDYNKFLNQMNLYRQRIWTCNISGKPNLTYEEALVSEKNAKEKVQVLPQELMVLALHIIQFSMLPLKDLADKIVSKLREHFFVGEELQGRKGDDWFACRILRIVNGGPKPQYEVDWLDKSNHRTGSTLLNECDLMQKKALFSRRFIMSFIRESTCRSFPWILNEKLRKKHVILKDPPGELEGRVFIKDGQVFCNKKGRKDADNGNSRLIKEDDETTELIKYPIEDLFVTVDPGDPVFAERPSPSRDFNVPMDCVGNLLMIWDFCSSFGRLLQLWPFSLGDFENAICHKGSNLILVIETHSAILQLLLKCNSEYASAMEQKYQKTKITVVNWTEYLCVFLEMINISNLKYHTSTIKRGQYGHLDAQTKLCLLCELVNHALETDIFREVIDKYIEEQQVLRTTRWEDLLQEGKKRREQKEQLKGEPMDNQLTSNPHVESAADAQCVLENENHCVQNGMSKKRKRESMSSELNHVTTKSERNHSNGAAKRMGGARNQDVQHVSESTDDLSREKALNWLKNAIKEKKENMSKDERREYFETELEKRGIRANTLGKDRHYNRYLWFRRDGRIFVESSDSDTWGYYSSKEELDAFMGSLNLKGVRERDLQKQLDSLHGKICKRMQKRLVDLGGKTAAVEEGGGSVSVRRSSRVRAPPSQNPAASFLRYVNKWRAD